MSINEGAMTVIPQDYNQSHLNRSPFPHHDRYLALVGDTLARQMGAMYGQKQKTELAIRFLNELDMCEVIYTLDIFDYLESLRIKETNPRRMRLIESFMDEALPQWRREFSAIRLGGGAQLDTIVNQSLTMLPREERIPFLRWLIVGR